MTTNTSKLALGKGVTSDQGAELIQQVLRQSAQPAGRIQKAGISEYFYAIENGLSQQDCVARWQKWDGSKYSASGWVLSDYRLTHFPALFSGVVPPKSGGDWKRRGAIEQLEKFVNQFGTKLPSEVVQRINQTVKHIKQAQLGDEFAAESQGVHRGTLSPAAPQVGGVSHSFPSVGIDLEIPPSLASRMAAKFEGGGTADLGTWDPNAWHEFAQFIPAEMPSRFSREIIAQIFDTCLKQGDVMGAYMAMQLWGWGSAGIGPVRTKWVLAGGKGGAPISPALVAEIAQKLRDSLAEIAADPYRAYQSLSFGGKNNIKFFGPAFFTKWLYFVTAQGDPRSVNALPILDEKVRKWLTAETGWNIAETPTAKEYRRYVELLTAWGKTCGWTAAQVEETIFDIVDGRIWDDEVYWDDDFEDDSAVHISDTPAPTPPSFTVFDEESEDVPTVEKVELTLHPEFFGDSEAGGAVRSALIEVAEASQHYTGYEFEGQAIDSLILDVVEEATYLFHRIAEISTAHKLEMAAIQLAPQFENLAKHVQPQFLKNLLDKPQHWVNQEHQLSERIKYINAVKAQVVASIKTVNDNAGLAFQSDASFLNALNDFRVI